jgi:hypothetical protein
MQKNLTSFSGRYLLLKADYKWDSAPHPRLTHLLIYQTLIGHCRYFTANGFSTQPRMTAELNRAKSILLCSLLFTFQKSFQLSATADCCSYNSARRYFAELLACLTGFAGPQQFNNSIRRCAQPDDGALNLQY